MSFLNRFFSPSAQKLEHKGDSMFDAQLWGQAKQFYERALEKVETQESQNSADHQRLTGKILRVKQALVREHQQDAENYLEGGYLDEARELLLLALEFTSDEKVKKELEQMLVDIELKEQGNSSEEGSEYFYGLDEDFDDESENDAIETAINLQEDEEFVALCNTLPEEVSAAYHSYGEKFRTGYVALNQGDFQSAIDNFQHALLDNPQPDSYIPLELATAYLNLGKTEKAQMLLENFISYHPEALPGYQLLCEIYWDQMDFSKVDSLMASIPENLKQSLAVVLIQGETLYKSGNYQQAKTFYMNFIKTYGQNETIARELAKTCEALGELDLARNIYKDIIEQCTSCRTRIDPQIKDRYAELSFAAGIFSSDILEIYLALAGERPEEAARYFDRVSRIYKAQGNAYEAARFRAFSNRARK